MNEFETEHYKIQINDEMLSCWHKFDHTHGKDNKMSMIGINPTIANAVLELTQNNVTSYDTSK